MRSNLGCHNLKLLQIKTFKILIKIKANLNKLIWTS